MPNSRRTTLSWTTEVQQQRTAASNERIAVLRSIVSELAGNDQQLASLGDRAAAGCRIVLHKRAFKRQLVPDRWKNTRIEDGETCLEEFPLAYVELLASVDESTVSNASAELGETEELKCPGEKLVPILRDLRRLAQLANENGKGFFLWGSLRERQYRPTMRSSRPPTRLLVSTVAPSAAAA